MAMKFDKDNKLFQVDYQAPFGGIDSTAYASAINPANFASLTKGIVSSNYLLPVSWGTIIQQVIASSAGAYIGYVPIANSTTVGYIILNNSLVIVQSDGSGGVTYTSVSGYAPASDQLGYFSYIVIEDLLIWTVAGWHEIWSFNTTSKAFSKLTDYVGGGFLGILNNQLINLGGESQADGAVPYRISWSAPGQYGQFKPYDVGTGTGNFAAGFNDLPSTSDVLQGMLTIGTVAYLFRNQGITQMNPTGSGIKPFSFNHLWASELGIGSVLPDSISQYGNIGAFIADSGVYIINLSGLTEVTGAAKNTIYSKLNAVAAFAQTTALPVGTVTCRCYPYLTSTPSVFYVIGILSGVSTSSPNTSALTYDLYALDLNNGSNCYQLGTINLAPDNTADLSPGAVGKLSYINKNYQNGPPPPPPPSTYPRWAANTYYWRSEVIRVLITGVYYLFQIQNTGFVDVAPIAWNIGAIGDLTTNGSVVFKYVGPQGWTASTAYAVGDYATYRPVSSGFTPPFVYICTTAGTSGSAQSSWTTSAGDVINDNGTLWSCLGCCSEILAPVVTGASSVPDSWSTDAGDGIGPNPPPGPNQDVRVYSFHPGTAKNVSINLQSAMAVTGTGTVELDLDYSIDGGVTWNFLDSQSGSFGPVTETVPDGTYDLSLFQFRVKTIAFYNDGGGVNTTIDSTVNSISAVLSEYNAAVNNIVTDSNGFLQQIQEQCGIANFPGGFSAYSEPSWGTPGTVTKEIDDYPAWWLGIGAPGPATTVDINVAKLVPLFVSITNNLVTAEQSKINAQVLSLPTATEVATFVFRKEQFEFGQVPTVSKVAFLASLINTGANGRISVSVDGGLTFNTAFPDIIITSGVGNPGLGIIDNVYSDGIQSLERPQLIIKLTNTQIVEAWYQGTYAPYPLI